MASTPTFHVSGSDCNLSLVEFLARRLEISKKKAKQLLDDRVVFVNRQRVWMARHTLKRGDLVEAQAPPEKREAATTTLRILHRDEDYIVVDKPAGMLSNGPNSAESRLREQIDSEAVEAVHRLDRDTSGCLLLALNGSARDAIVPLFEERDIKKVYHALVFGDFPAEIRTITKAIDGLPAETVVRIIARSPDVSHLELTLLTGRTHQIRKHLASTRHPVLGDKQYAIGQIVSDRLRTVPRQMLHASLLEFAHPRGGWKVRAESRLPADVKRVMLDYKLLKGK